MELKKILAAVLCTSMLVSTASVFASAANSRPDFASRIESRFENPSMEQRPAARWWMAEGLHTDETIRESIRELYDYGFGAVEFVTLDESEYLDDATYAWGSEEWIHDSQLVVEECTKLGMGVSFTSGTHWSTSNLVSINPDEEAASQELGYRTIDLAPGETYDGVLPQAELTENATKIRLVKVTAAKVAKATESGATNLESDSLTDVTGLATQNPDGSWSIRYTAPSDGSYTLFAFWQYGTSESYKPAISNSYTINYFSKEGANALIDYWEETVLTPELRELIKENGNVTMFEDSLEVDPHGANMTGNLWCTDYLEEFESRRGYDVSKYLPVLILSNFAHNRSKTYAYSLEGEEDLAQKIRNDLYQTNTELYMENHLEVMREWLNRYGITLRAQNSFGQMLEISQPVKSIDFVESESLATASDIDAYRGQSGAAHLYNKLYSSETNAVIMGNYKYSNNYLNQTIYTQFASGIQKTVTHGYSSEYGPDGHCDWPGFEGMYQRWGERYNKRQPNSVDYPKVWGEHISRLQSVLMQGISQMDVGILRSDYLYQLARHRFFDYNDTQGTNLTHQHQGYYWQDTTLQDAGYTYDYFSPYLLQDEDITCENGIVQADSVGYKALLLYQDELPLESAKVLYEWAKDGLPVVLVDGPSEEIIENQPTRIKYNESAAVITGSNDGKDAELAEVMAQIKALDTVKTVKTQAQAKDALQSLGVKPRAEFVQPNQKLLTTMRKAEDATYLYVYHYMYEDTDNYTGQISVEGIYKPYTYDTWSNNAEEIGAYSYSDGRTVLNVDIAPGEVVVFALDPNDKAAKTVIETENVEKVTVENGKFVLQVPQSGAAAVRYSDGSSDQVTAEVPDDITLNQWNLTVESWEPGDKVTRTEDRGTGHSSTEVTYTTNKVQIEVGRTALIPWKDIEQVGPTVSGVGTYSNTFTLPDSWSAQNRLVFQADSFCGGTAAVFVNGKQVDVNIDTCTADLTGVVNPGENTIEVRVTSSLRNKFLPEGYPGWSNYIPDFADYGMTGSVTLAAYTAVAVEETDTPSSSDTPSTSEPEPSTSQPDNSSETGASQPSTGDNTAMIFVGSILLLLTGAATLVFKKRKMH